MRFIYLLLIGVLLVSGCSFVPIAPDIPASAEALQSDQWRARGKFSYRSDEITQSGNFDWQQDGDDYQMRLYGPLGMGSVRISGNPNLVRVQTGDQDIRSDQPLQLLHSLTGFEIPLNSMPIWLLGETATARPSNRVLDSENRLQSFTERNWSLHYDDYSEFGDQQIPTTINAQKNDVHMRLLVKTWERQ